MPRRKVTEDEQFDFNNKHMDLAREHFGRSTVVFYVLHSPFVEFQGSGVLFQVADKYFILSTAHVLDQGTIHNRTVYLGPRIQGGEIMSLNGLKVLTSQYPESVDIKDLKMRKKDPFDVAVCELNEDILSRILPNGRFVRMPEILQSYPLVPATYVVMGFLGELTKQRVLEGVIRSEALPYITDLYQGEVPYRKDWDIFLDYARQAKREDGKIAPNCDLDGISGCGIWRLSNPTMPLEDWSLEDTHLVGIEHLWSETDRYIRAQMLPPA